jgi:hypothetical protein
MANTLLDLVQDILSTLDSDAVSSISDTVEADQVADIVKKTYRDIIDEYQLPGQRVITNLESVSDTDRPNLLKLPDDTQALIHWQYDTRLTPTDPLHYSPVEYKPPHEFLRYVNARNSSDVETYSVVYAVTDIPIIVDIRTGPMFWTSFDDKFIVTDNVNLDVDASLQASKTQAWLEKRWVFHKEDDFVINLPENLIALLYRTAENEAYALYKQTVNPKLEQKEKRLRIRAQRNKHRTQQYENNGMNGAPNYGRK